MESFKKNLLAGIFFLFPVLIFIILFKKVLRVLEPLAHLLVSGIEDVKLLGTSLSLIISALILLVLSYLAGIVSRSKIGESINNKMDGILGAFPGYYYMKNSYQAYFGVDKIQFEVVLVPIDGWMIGFVIERLDNSDITVFIPGSPDTMSGNLVIFKENEVKKSNLTQKEALEILRRTGVGFKSIS